MILLPTFYIIIVYLKSSIVWMWYIMLVLGLVLVVGLPTGGYSLGAATYENLVGWNTLFNYFIGENL